MAFSSVPSESKEQINKAGQQLAINPSEKVALAIVDKWRACHAYPINTFQSTLRTKLKKFEGTPIVAQRLKRMPTIIDKLRRHNGMKLARMQDIGGVRAVVDSLEDVYKLASEYKDSSRFSHELVDSLARDYIQNPRDEDGYRSLHLIYKYKGTIPKAIEYNNLLVELQIRTKLQHTWATAVETMGSFLGQALKSRLGDKEWLDFFALVSSAFSHIEKTNPLQRHSKMSRQEIYIAISKANEELKVLEKIKGYSSALNEINKNENSKGWSYHLIILNSSNKTVEIKSYKRGAMEKALTDYARIEEQALKEKEIEAVLVSAGGPLSILRQAYPNFFLDIKDFVNKIEMIINIAKK